MIFLTLGFVVLFAFVLVFRMLPASSLVKHIALAAMNIGFLYLLIGAIEQMWPVFGFMALAYASLFVVRRDRWYFWGALGALLVVFLGLKEYPGFAALFTLRNGATVLGLSYILFRSFHIIIDYRDGAIEPRPSPLAYVNYSLSLFTFLSGPIQRYEDFAASGFLRNNDRPALGEVGAALYRGVCGVFKVNVLSAIFSAVHGRGIEMLTGATGLPAEATAVAIAGIGFVGYLYFNFSGYMDIVISIGRVAGFDLPENFNNPFEAQNIQEFWTKWHITLSDWVRTYLFNPMMLWSADALPGKNGPQIAATGSIFLAFFIIGSWHSGGINGIVYGAVLGAGAVAHRLYQMILQARLGKKGVKSLTVQPVYRVFAQGLNFTFFAFSIICLWPELGTPQVTRGLTNFAAMATGYLLLWLAAAATYFVANAVGPYLKSDIWLQSCESYWARTILAVTLMFIALIANVPTPSFIYQGY